MKHVALTIGLVLSVLLLSLIILALVTARVATAAGLHVAPLIERALPQLARSGGNAGGGMRRLEAAS
jgi:hypothetical protein